MSTVKVLLPVVLLACSWVAVGSNNVSSNVTLPVSQAHKPITLVSKYRHSTGRTRFIPRRDVISHVRAGFDVTASVTTALTDATTASSNATTPPHSITVVPSNPTTVPSNPTTVPSNITIIPSNITTVPSNITTVPSNITTVPSNITTIPSNSTTVPSNITTAPSNSTTVPSNTTAATTTTAKTTSPNSRNGGDPQGCRKVSACVCETQTGQRVDLTPLANNNGTPRFRDLVDTTSSYGYAYSWNPCYAFTEGSCQNVAMLQTVPTLGTCYNLGNQSSVDFIVSSSLGFVIKYVGDGTPEVQQRITYIRLECDTEVESEFTVQGEPVMGTYYFTLRSRYACLTGGSPTTHTNPATPGVITVTFPGPTSNPVYSLKTVVDLLFVLTLVGVAGLVVLLMVLTVICVRRGMTAESGHHGVTTSRAFGDAHLFPPPQYESHDKKQLLSA